MSNTCGLRAGMSSQPAITRGHSSASTMRRQEEAKFLDGLLLLVTSFIWDTRRITWSVKGGHYHGIARLVQGFRSGSSTPHSFRKRPRWRSSRSEEHTSELQSPKD